MTLRDTDRHSVTYDLRGSGEVQRYHTWPTIRSQSVGEHTWQVMRIWFQVFGPMAPEISTAILLHDAGERVTGDMPFPLKRELPGLKKIMDDAESRALQVMLGDELFLSLPALSDEQMTQLKICDLIEMYEFGTREEMMGNRYAGSITHCTLETALSLSVSLPDNLRQQIHQYLVRVCGLPEEMAP